MHPLNQKEYDKAVATVKARVARWPSAYASGQVVVEYKKAMSKLGKPAYADAKAHGKETSPLARWFAERWTDIRTGKPCGSVKSDNYYPTCRPLVRVTKATPVTMGELSKGQRTHMIATKQSAGPNVVRYKETAAVRKKHIVGRV